MSAPAITYVFRDNLTYAIREGKVIAASANPDEVEAQVKLAYGEDGPDGYGEDRAYADGRVPPPSPERGALQQEYEDLMRQGRIEEAQRLLAQHDELAMQEQAPSNEYGEPDPYGEMGYGREGKVVTPSGLKGTVLGKVAGIWGDEVTVRLENGRIVKLPTGTELHAQKTASAPRRDPIQGLEARLASTPDGTRASLVSRAAALVALRKEAADLIREGVSYADSLRLDQLVVTAEAEQAEITAAIAHLDDVDSYQPPPAFTMRAAHSTAGISREDASWLDHTLDDMIKEAEATDFTKLMDEGPEAFAAAQPDVALADTGVTRQMASSFISEKTAGVDRTIAAPYMETFLARVEACRRTELAARKTTTQKEAATTEDQYKDLPDDSLFL